LFSPTDSKNNKGEKILVGENTKRARGSNRSTNNGYRRLA